MTTKDKVIGLAKATHFGPMVLVVTISFVLAITQLSFTKSLEIAFAIFAGQCVVGWTNDLIDHPRDSASGRVKKPLVHGAVTHKQLQVGIAIALIAAILLSFLGPLGVKGGLLHMLGIGSATAYNFGVKANWFSFVPYAISFGAMPWAIYEAAGKHPPAWLFIDFMLIAVSFHFLNVIKDLEWDRAQLVMGLPQRIGKESSVRVALLLVILSVIIGFIQ
jgi:4-hydroxybenzoate polyprenyltransferase